MCDFFFFNQKTAYEWRICDWSSDVCSSDLRSSLCWVLSLFAMIVLRCHAGSPIPLRFESRQGAGRRKSDGRPVGGLCRLALPRGPRPIPGSLLGSPILLRMPARVLSSGTTSASHWPTGGVAHRQLQQMAVGTG